METKQEYRRLAKEFKMHLRIGKYGIKFFPTDPTGRSYKLFQVVPLDGWITDPKEVERVIRGNGLEL